MLERLREQPGGAEIPATVGNFADVSVDGEFRLVYVVFQTFHVLGSLAEQVRCFQNVAAHLVHGGYFVLETNYSPPDLGTPDGSMTVWNLEPDRVMLSFERRGDELQAVTDIETWLTEDSIRLIPMRYRYASPVELDLMARLAGLELRHRWGGWDRTDPGPDSKAFVSVYVKERGAASYPTRSAAGRSDAEGGAWPLPKADQEASAEELVAELANGEPVLQLA